MITHRASVSLMELLIVVSIIMVLFALTLSAVTRSRASSRRIQCATNLRQIGIATSMYSDAFRGTRPPGGGGNGHSLFARVLPYMEQNPAYQKVDFSQLADSQQTVASVWGISVPVFVCPADYADDFSDVMKPTNYAGNYGRGVQRYKYDGAYGYIDYGPISLASFTDGLSNTAAISEILPGDGTTHILRSMNYTRPLHLFGEYDQFAAECRSGRFVGVPDVVTRGRPWVMGNAGVTLYNHLLRPFSPSCNNGNSVQEGAFSSASLHSTIVNTLFADGHVVSVDKNVDLKYWRQIGSRNGAD